MITRVKPIFFVIFLLILIAAPVAAGSDGITSDSVTTGLAIVDGFYVETQAAIKALPLSVGASEILKASDNAREQAIKELQSLKWSVSPGRKRYRRVVSIVEPYMAGIITSLKGRGATLNLADKARLEQVVAQLAVVKAAKLKALEESLKSEIQEKRREAPVPVIDQPRGPRPPEGGATIWDR